MTTDNTKTGEEPTPETICTLNIPQKINNVQHNAVQLLIKCDKSFEQSELGSNKLSVLFPLLFILHLSKCVRDIYSGAEVHKEINMS
jgi:hypothetical protein